MVVILHDDESPRARARPGERPNVYEPEGVGVVEMDDVNEQQDTAGGVEPVDPRHVRSACDAVLAHIVATGTVTFSLVELVDDLGRACGNIDVLDRLVFGLRARLTRDLNVIAKVRRSRTSTREASV